MIVLILKRSLSKAYLNDIESSIDFISRFVKIEAQNVSVYNSSSRPNLKVPNSEKVDAYIDQEKLNGCKSICSYFQSVNEQIDIGGVFIGCVETHRQKIASQKVNKIPVIGHLNKGYEFIYHRVIPKSRGLRHIYNFLTQRKNRRLTKTEVLGRLVRAGFTIIDIEENIDGKLYFAARKTSSKIDTRLPGFGLLYKMPRIGKNGNIIHVYKFRTMHPFSEYLQGYIFENHGTTDGDKIINDYRVSNWGRIMRKYWIDELPMILNLIKGDIKLVGIRPLSKHKFGTYPSALQRLRIKTKPGLFPPYYADLPKNKVDFFKSEEKYLRAYLKLGTKIDRKYLALCLKNILLKMKRSA